ncbi:hypothetical protein GY45DRAFT_877044 [Cubamyces sp. BRFM 1775]|nr:hypothetical protein GY45DRAFT_877044 [Cubamyces sp. BRFM 1775]
MLTLCHSHTPHLTPLLPTDRPDHIHHDRIRRDGIRLGRDALRRLTFYSPAFHPATTRMLLPLSGSNMVASCRRTATRECWALWSLPRKWSLYCARGFFAKARTDASLGERRCRTAHFSYTCYLLRIYSLPRNVYVSQCFLYHYFYHILSSAWLPCVPPPLSSPSSSRRLVTRHILLCTM